MIASLCSLKTGKMVGFVGFKGFELELGFKGFGFELGFSKPTVQICKRSQPLDWESSTAKTVVVPTGI